MLEVGAESIRQSRDVRRGAGAGCASRLKVAHALVQIREKCRTGGVVMGGTATTGKKTNRFANRIEGGFGVPGPRYASHSYLSNHVRDHVEGASLRA